MGCVFVLSLTSILSAFILINSYIFRFLSIILWVIGILGYYKMGRKFVKDAKVILEKLKYSEKFLKRKRNGRKPT